MDSTIIDTTLVANVGMSGKVYEFITLWIIFIVIIFVALLIRYTFGVGFNKDNPNPYVKETFGMPRGVFRGILTLSLLVVILLLEAINFRGNIQVVDKQLVFPEDKYKELIVAFQMMIAFYFGSKVVHHVTSADRKKSEKIAETVTKPGGKEPTTGDFDEPGAEG